MFLFFFFYFSSHVHIHSTRLLWNACDIHTQTTEIQFQNAIALCACLPVHATRAVHILFIIEQFLRNFLGAHSFYYFYSKQWKSTNFHTDDIDQRSTQFIINNFYLAPREKSFNIFKRLTRTKTFLETVWHFNW